MPISKAIKSSNGIAPDNETFNDSFGLVKDTILTTPKFSREKSVKRNLLSNNLLSAYGKPMSRQTAGIAKQRTVNPLYNTY